MQQLIVLSLHKSTGYETTHQLSKPIVKSLTGFTMIAGRCIAAGKAIAMRDEPKASATQCLRPQRCFKSSRLAPEICQISDEHT